MIPNAYAASLARSNNDNNEPRQLLQRVEKDETLDQRVRISVLHHSLSPSFPFFFFFPPLFHSIPIRRPHLSHQGGQTIQTKSRIARAKAASENVFETLGYHAVAVASAVFAGVNPSDVNKLSLGYLAARSLFAYIYVVLQDNRRMAPARSLAWTVAQAITITLYVKAARALTA